ncbi:hypothetical protein DQD18_15030 [Salmonella enterica subsp. enterica serovar Oranienburg]|nr:hypothetical protein [Salmonella enterica subsp. enterica serovar Oranienburg]EBV1655890.1 hypothetical protein [Salmonella enterica subsp. enterica serovar Oranienburg]EBW7315163.1 hypothetical protein [Salmonella enterica subsp. enterica serovar Oranienburg]ECF2300905.1 hypothetical protein [Salmonella enterica subsp. enterica serovar Oranienburg]ECI5748695.1 hypothetical protein [Salmonella enterica subsp. enterica]
MMNLTKGQKKRIKAFLVPGRLGTGFLLGAGFMLWLAIERKPVFDEMVLFIIDFLNLTHD